MKEKPIKTDNQIDKHNDEYMVWDDLFGKLSWKYKPTKSGEMSLDSESAYNELKNEFILIRKKKK